MNVKLMMPVLGLIVLTSIPARSLPTDSVLQQETITVTQLYPGPVESGDTVRVRVAGAENLSGVFLVDSDGNITAPRLGQIAIAGATTSLAAERVTARIIQLQLLKRPDVVLDIIGRPVKEVIVGGAVVRAGSQAFKIGMRLSDLLDGAGLQPSSDTTRVQIDRGGVVIVVDYQKFINGQNTTAAANPVIESGDRIYVRSMEQLAGIARVIGEIKDPKSSIVPLSNRTTVSQALQQAGGLTLLGDPKRVSIRRDNRDVYVDAEALLSGDLTNDIQLLDGDTVVVPKRVRKAEATVSGAVRNAGGISLVSPVTLLQAIGQAGGLLDGANRKSVVVRRLSLDGKLVSGIADLDRDTDAAMLLQDGDVIEVLQKKRISSFDFNRIAGSVIAAVSLLNVFRR
jgi:protein involved in polysaccharide export with SLBB domain